METLIVALILMAVSGLGYVAYNDPDLYEDKFFNKLAGLLAIVVIGIAVYSITVTQVYASLRGLIPDELTTDAETIKDSFDIPAHFLIGGIVFQMYTFFLSWVAFHRIKTIEKQSKDG